MEQNRPGRIDDWNPAPEYIAENEPKQKKIVFNSSREKRMSLARAEAAKESISEIVAQPWEKFFEDEEQIASRIRKSSTKEQLGARAKSSLRRSSSGREKRSSIGSYLGTSARNMVPSTSSELSVSSPRRNQEATAVFDFKARNERELSVSRNESVFVDEIKNEQWAQCRKESASDTLTGLVPLAYLRNNDRSSLSSVPSSPSSAKKGSAVAAFDLDAKSERHLRLTKGDTVILTNKLDKNWYEGVNPLTNESGIIPANYLSKIVEPSKNPRNRTVSSDEVFEISSQQTTTASPSKSEKIRQSLKDELDLAMKELSSHLQQ